GGALRRGGTGRRAAVLLVVLGQARSKPRHALERADRRALPAARIRAASLPPAAPAEPVSPLRYGARPGGGGAAQPPAAVRRDRAAARPGGERTARPRGRTRARAARRRRP